MGVGLQRSDRAATEATSRCYGAMLKLKGTFITQSCPRTCYGIFAQTPSAANLRSLHRLGHS